jgi:hypothetical protein
MLFVMPRNEATNASKAPDSANTRGGTENDAFHLSFDKSMTCSLPPYGDEKAR